MKAISYIVVVVVLVSALYLSCADDSILSSVCLQPSLNKSSTCNQTLCSPYCATLCASSLNDTSKKLRCAGRCINYFAINATIDSQSRFANSTAQEFCNHRLGAAARQLRTCVKLWEKNKKFDMNTLNMVASAAQTDIDNCVDEYGERISEDLIQALHQPILLISDILATSNIIFNQLN